ncbi:hypothetical protein HWB19_gp043 [Cronobacter phage vB_CsaP_009]|uniref:Uncharacterized protein n=1 Tax=Cronobacter phage vB_CsaP_009 TaxID=2699738 RepID=A0A679FDW6_9CAUD|nr:hypothetical protein HWB19_gp043 [Cronobacter phage vB_CsaP_009]BBU72689.1 hypothetical protein [Cronobacter phage vB_CsaP_009]
MKTPEFLKKITSDRKKPYILSRMTKPNDGLVYELASWDKASFIRVASFSLGDNMYLRLEDAMTVIVKPGSNVRVIGKIKTIEIELDE